MYLCDFQGEDGDVRCIVEAGVMFEFKIRGTPYIGDTTACWNHARHVLLNTHPNDVFLRSHVFQ